MPLTDAAIRQAKPKEKAYKIADSGGLFLLVNPDGSKCWRIEYHYASKEKVYNLGVYPKVMLTEARDMRDVAHKFLSNGIDPGMPSEHEMLRLKAHRECTLELGLSSEDCIKLAARIYYNMPMSDADKEILRKIRERQNKKVPQTVN